MHPVNNDNRVQTWSIFRQEFGCDIEQDHFFRVYDQIHGTFRLRCFWQHWSSCTNFDLIETIRKIRTLPATTRVVLHVEQLHRELNTKPESNRIVAKLLNLDYQLTEFLVKKQTGINDHEFWLLHFANQNVHYRTEERTTIFHFLAEKGIESAYAPLFPYFLAKGADLNATTIQGLTPLHIAVARNNLITARFLVVNGAKVDLKDNSGRTPLMKMDLFAPERKSMIELLLELGADPNEQDNDGNTILNTVIFFHHIELIMLLLTKGGANPHLRNNFGRSAYEMSEMSPTLRSLLDLYQRLNRLS